MTRRLPSLVTTVALAASVLGLPQQATATLGEPATSVAADRKALGAVQRATTIQKNYTVQEVVSPSTTVREFVNASGVVFAVAWKGLVPPDLTTLLGKFAPEYQDAAGKTPRVPGRKRMQVNTDRIVVQKWGHMRALQGRAYVPALLPSGVTIDEIQ
ncbi:DUF2844 domain-containing protein [Geomonas sp. RF6]|uniref:DUF2844 domain-containing protein n=1 Tax=Geomonas sp. RF6 TaxID=2897342 RepID=UPI001E5677C0|nr:DUF2844 domain-containing protein [Geomonas sp. RF6]UFS70808.1 DUF2844 domain-containing protein [Geomonas sp. RF6]